MNRLILLLSLLLLRNTPLVHGDNKNNVPLPLFDNNDNSKGKPREGPPKEDEKEKSDHLPKSGWTEGQLQCLNLMVDADFDIDHALNHIEYLVFANHLANRVYGMWTTLSTDQEWELTELYETLVLLNPSGKLCGIDIKGSAYGALAKIEDRQEYHLKIICLETKKAILKVGPDW